MTPEEKYERACARHEMRNWGLPDRQFQLALESPAFRELMRSRRDATPPDAGACPMAPLWQLAGRPAGNAPAEWFRRRYHLQSHGETRFVDDGDKGPLADWQTTAWYAHDLDPRISFEVLCDLLYRPGARHLAPCWATAARSRRGDDPR